MKITGEKKEIKFILEREPSDTREKETYYHTYIQMRLYPPTLNLIIRYSCHYHESIIKLLNFFAPF